MENKDRPRRHSEALNSRTFIINHNSHEVQDFLWAQFQGRAMRSQQNPTSGNIMRAKEAHAAWEESFLDMGGIKHV